MSISKNKIRLTKASISAIKPQSSQFRVWDSSLRGYGVLVSPGGSKTYFVQRKVNGRTRRVTIGRADELGAEPARRKAEQIIATFADGRDPVAEAKMRKAQEISLREAFAAYKLAPKKKGAGRGSLKKPKTIRDIEKAERRFSDWLDLPAHKITGDMVRKRHAEMAATSPAQANLAMRYLRATFGHIMADSDEDDPLIRRNPVDRLNRVSAWAEVKPRKTLIPEERIPEWIEAVQTRLKGLQNENEMRDVILFLMFTGARISEAIGDTKDGYEPLRWSDVDLDAALVRFRNTKNRHEHILPMGAYLTQLLRSRKEAAGRSPSVFADRSAREPKNLRSAFKRLEDVTGLHLSAHCLRRTFATTANRIGLPAYTVKRLLNHVSGNDVTEGYIEVSPEDMRTAMQRIESRLLAPARPETAAEIQFGASQ